MGGDGGTIGSTRAYLRGAGKACHTADHPSSARERSKKAVSDDAVGRAKLTLSTCAISGEVLEFSPGTAEDIVACPYGRLYKREKVLEALLRRARGGVGGGNDNDRNNNTDAAASASISHIRGIKDLHTVRFHVMAVSSGEGITQNNGKRNGTYYTPACPITGSDIGSGKVPSYVIVRSAAAKVKKNGNVDEDEVSRAPNVLSERAIKEMGVPGLQAEFGPFEEKDMILLAPPLTGGVFDEIKRKWEERVELDRVAKLEKKKDKKRKRNPEDATLTTSHDHDMKPSSAKTNDKNSLTKDMGNKHSNTRTINEKKKSSSAAVNEARSAVQSAISHNPVLLNLFGAGKDEKKQNPTEKEKRDLLFTRNC